MDRFWWVILHSRGLVLAWAILAWATLAWATLAWAFLAWAILAWAFLAWACVHALVIPKWIGSGVGYFT